MWNINRLDDLKWQMENNRILWTDTYKVSSKTELLFFTQYERELDKFKPSRSGFLTGLFRETWYEQGPNDKEEKLVEEWNKFEIENVLNFMKKHPIKAYVYSGLQLRDIAEEMSGIKCLNIYIKDWFYDKKWKFIHWRKLNLYINASIKLVKKLNKNYNCLVVVKSDNYSPMLDIIVRRKIIYDFEECTKLEKLMEKFEDKWYMNITLDQYDLELTNSEISNKDKIVDAELEKKFIKRLSYYYAETDEDYDTLWCNCEELIDIKVVD